MAQSNLSMRCGFFCSQSYCAMADVQNAVRQHWLQHIWALVLRASPHIAESIACTQAILAEDPGNLEALEHMVQVYCEQGCHAEVVCILGGRAAQDPHPACFALTGRPPIVRKHVYELIPALQSVSGLAEAHLTTWACMAEAACAGLPGLLCFCALLDCVKLLPSLHVSSLR